MNNKPLNSFLNRTRWLVLSGCLGFAILLWGAPARAVIALQDGSTAITAVGAATVSQSVTVTAGATVLVVLLEDKNVLNAEPATLTWNGATLTKAVQQDLPNSTYRGSAIYYCFNPPVGTATLSVTVPGANYTWLTAYTLNGTDTIAPPLTNSVGANSTADPLTFNIANVVAGSWAAVNSTWANDAGGNPVITATGGTDFHSYIDLSSTPVTAGYVAGLSAGTVTFSCLWIPGNNQKANFAAAVFIPYAGPTPPFIWTQPKQKVVFTNTTVKFSSVAFGSLPLSYQWFTNNTTVALTDTANRTGSTSNVLTLSKTTLTDAANYTVVVTNLYGSATSSVANLSIVSPSGAYESAVMTNSTAPFAFYTFSETSDPSTTNVVAYDSIGAFDGTYGITTSNGFNGILGPQPSDGLSGFPTGNKALLTVSNVANSFVTLPAFNFNNGVGTNVLTITAWVKPQGNQANGTAIVISRSGSTVAGLAYENVTNADGTYRLGYNWNNDSGAFNWDSGLTPPLNVWSLVSLVVTPTTATIYIINTSGLTFSTHVYNHVNQIFEGPTQIGSDNGQVARNFNGSIDEVALFGQALSQSQLLSLFSAASGNTAFPPSIGGQPYWNPNGAFAGIPASVTMFAGGALPLSYQWYTNGIATALSDTANRIGSTSNVLTIPSPTLADAGNYTVIVTNLYGAITSSVATLTINVPSGAYERSVITNGPLAFYGLNETNDPSVGGVLAADYMGAFPGTYGKGALNGFNNILGPQITADGLSGFPNGNTALQTAPGVNQSWVTLPPFNFNNGAGANTFTFTSWVYPTAATVDAESIVFFRLLDNSSCGGLTYAQNPSANGQHAVSYNWNNELLTYQWDSGLFTPLNTWSMLNLVITPTNTTLYILNTNGLGVATVAHVNVPLKFNVPTYIGTDPYSAGVGIAGGNANYNRNFAGKIDEVAIFNRALSQTEMFAMYTAASGIAGYPPALAGNPAWSTNRLYAGMSATITAPLAAGTAPLSYTWLSAVTNSGVYTRVTGAGISGSNSITMTITNAQTAYYRDYVVRVSNPIGSITNSTPATLVVLPIGSAENFTLNFGSNGTPVVQASGDWNSQNVWSPDGMGASDIANIGHIGSTFEVVSGSRLLTPAGTNYCVFPGTQLTVDGDGIYENGTLGSVGEIRFMNSISTATTNYFKNLVLNGGQLNIGAGTDVILQGTMTVTTNSVLYTSVGGSTTFRVDSYLTGSGGIAFYLNNGNPGVSLNITGNTNTFTGQWDIEMGPLVGSGLNSLGTNTITINTNGILETTYPLNNTNSMLVLNGQMFLTQTDAFDLLIVNGTPVAPGTYSAATLSANYPSNFPATFPALYGAAATTASGQITVLVASSPVAITQQPANVRATTNTAATFSVRASGYPRNYQWYKVSTGGVTNLLAGATNASYTTALVQDSDSGTGYLVVVSNQVNRVTSSKAILTAGHLLMTSGYLTDNQYFGFAAADIKPNLLFANLYPLSTWVSTNTPSKTEYLTKFDSSQDLPDNAGQQIYGWFTPSVSGDYVFFTTSDKSGALWLSTNSSPTNIYQIAQDQDYMVDRDWTCLATNTGEYINYVLTATGIGEWRSDVFISGGGFASFAALNPNYNNGAGWLAYPGFNSGDNGIPLVAGNQYYIELDNYQDNGGQCAAVTYKLAGNADPSSNSPSLFTGNQISTLISDVNPLLPVAHPVIQSVAMSGSNLIISGTNGLVNAQYNLLSTTNLATPLANWTVAATHLFDVHGNFSATIAVVPGMPQMFYLLQQLK